MKIGIFGATIYNHNLGCQALSWALMAFLQKVSQKSKVRFDYVIFDRSIHEDCNKKFMKQFNLEENQVEFIIGSTPKFYKVKQNYAFFKTVSECDLIIDITQGDSFSDIYGDKRFLTWSVEKKLAEKKCRFILGPQTYGPFNKKRNRKIAMRIIEDADLVISRDQMSSDYIAKYTNKNIIQGIDVAFILPYEKKKIKQERINVGINISGLLWNKESKLNLKYKTDYQEYINKLLRYLMNNEKYNIYIISHVKNDYIGAKEVCKKYKNLNLVPMFKDALEAKSFISSMDCFIGSRMHATIAAISSGVPVIPVSYSRKFEGLYNSLHYEHVVSLEQLDTNESFKKTVNSINDLSILQEDVKDALIEANSRITLMVDELAKYIESIQ